MNNLILIANKKNHLNENQNIITLFNQFQLSKSSQLLESLSRNQAIQQTNIPDSLLLQVNSLKQQSSYLNTQINRLENKNHLSESDSTRLSDFKSVLLDNKVAFNDLMLYLEKTFPKYYEINYNPKIATIEDVQQKLRADEAVIEYFVGSDHIYSFTISKDTATVHQLAKVSDSTINRFREVIIPKGLNQDTDEAYRQFTSQSYQLYADLLTEPLTTIKKSKQPVTKLYIIPDKSLNYLSFDLLLTEKIAENSYQGYGNLPYLINEYTVSYGYSSSILFRQDSLKQERAFNGQVLAFAPSYEKLLADTAKLNQLGQFRNSLTPLKYNKSEVDGISRYFDTEVYKAGNATEKQFVENLPGNDIIHLAMHGLVDAKDSEKSRLVFTPVEDSIHDNYLHNFELYNLNIQAKLAVLSACNTGYGKLEGGEGVMSLARAFTYAGTESVVMSHWPADDESSSMIMQYFYKYLADGHRKDEALRKAKLAYLTTANPVKQNPFYWNNFVLMGDAQPVVRINPNRQAYWVVGLFFMAFTIIVLYSCNLIFVRKL
ncbi:MAG: CHAT domain-containing protein [Cyclobacteriaceae bacterium]